MNKLLKQFQKNERGEMNMGGIIIMGIGMVFLAVGFIMFPIATTATDDILAWTCDACTTITDADFTGLTAIVGIVPLLILVGFLAAAVITGFLGIKIMKGEGSAKFNPGNVLLLGLSIIFIAVGLIIFPVILEALCTIYYGGGTGIPAAYVGLEPLILLAPMLVLIAFIAAAVISGFFGIKNLSSMD